MAIEVHPIPGPGEPGITTPLNSEGEPYYMCMVYNADTLIAFADTATELVGLLIPGYLDIPEENLTDQATERIKFNVRAQVRHQARIMLDTHQELATPEELDILMGSRDNQPMLERWECPIPLILLDGYYAPWFDHPVPVAAPRDGGTEARRLFTDPNDPPPPEGLAKITNIVWLGFADEVEFLHGLSSIGEIQFGLHDPDPQGSGLAAGVAADLESFLNN